MTRRLALCLLLWVRLARADAGEDDWIAAASAAVAFGQAQGLPLILQIDNSADLPGHSPLGLQDEHGRCVLVVAARANPTAQHLEAMLAPPLRRLFIDGAAIHEVGHCHWRLHGHGAHWKPLPLLAALAPIRRWYERRLRTEEAFADMTEVAWLARFHPDAYDAMLVQILRVRTRYFEPRHDTLAWLRQARSAGPLPVADKLFDDAGLRMALGAD